MNDKQHQPLRVCVFCGASPKVPDEFLDLALNTGRQLALHEKPVVFINHNNFWQGVRSTFNTMHQEGFLSDRDRGLVSFHESPELAIQSLLDLQALIYIKGVRQSSATLIGLENGPGLKQHCMGQVQEK